MQSFHGRPAIRQTRTEDGRRQLASVERGENFRERRLSGEPAKFNTRTDQRRVSWENDLYERQSM